VEVVAMIKYKIEMDGDFRFSPKWMVAEDFENALRMFEKSKTFCEKHNISANVSLFGKDGFLIETTTINPAKVIVLN
jgi:hypothetical protein